MDDISLNSYNFSNMLVCKKNKKKILIQELW